MKIYTKTGDKGETSLLSGKRVSKQNPRIEAYGTIDELNSLISLIFTTPLKNDENEKIGTYLSTLKSIQHYLFNIGSHLACDDESIKKNLPQLSGAIIPKLEREMDNMNELVPPLKNFIIPGGGQLASQIHIARSFCRRAERKCCGLSDDTDLQTNIIPFLNRLSDYLFCLARFANYAQNIDDILWNKNNL